MATPDQTRITEDRARPRIMELWWALRPLTSVLRFMNTGAHPDDETSAMLAALTFRDGVNLSYACSTRGEGGQNDIGTEAGADLGALRTREMERACDILGMRMYWLSESPEDPITDFGFSKSGVETLGKWGRDRTLARFVEIIRTDRPDIICPTFLDIPGQHGHHRAMTEAAHLVMAAAADPDFPSNLPTWQVKKLYLPAWSGAGQAYDDDEPPPPATLTVNAADGDPVSGWSWERIGQQSRAFHRTQGMGRWVPAGPGRDWPLHLVESHVPGPDTAPWSGLPHGLADLANVPGAAPIAEPLRAAGLSIDAAVDAFPAFEAVAARLAEAAGHAQAALADCPEQAAGEIRHRLEAKLDQIAHALRLALGVEVRARTNEPWLHPGETAALTVEAAGPARISTELPDGWQFETGQLRLSEDTRPSDPYRSIYDPHRAPAPVLTVSMQTPSGPLVARTAFERAPVVLPARIAEPTPARAVLNTRLPGRTLEIAVSGVRPDDGNLSMVVPEGWSAARTGRGFRLCLPENVAPGDHVLPLMVDGVQAMRVRRIDHSHIAPTARAEPAVLRIRTLEVALTPGRIGYVGSGNDRVGSWLATIGADLHELSDDVLQSDEALAACDAIIIGIFAMRFRPGLAEAMPRLHRWVEAGGTLVTLYHRPWDNWDPDRIPPRRLEIGQPSLRWRVTDETAPVTHLAEHPVLATPNLIGPDDWDGWVKERGLYFAKAWDPAYQPLLEMADPGEAPHRGALLVADIGKGRHVHTSLILHHQMENLVPGAFRLMANLIAPRR